MQQGAVSPCETHHSSVDSLISVGVQLHCLTDDVGGLGSALVLAAAQQSHGVHRVQQLAVRGLEAVDLRQRAGDYDAHCVGHIVFHQRINDVLLFDNACAFDVRVQFFGF